MKPDQFPSAELLSARFQEAFDGLEMNGGLWPIAADRLAKVAREVMLAEHLVRARSATPVVLVPRDPTAEMIAAAVSEKVGDVDALLVWRAMIAAATEGGCIACGATGVTHDKEGPDWCSSCGGAGYAGPDDPTSEPSPLVMLRAAVEGVADDYMTSEAHHPGYVLIPTAKFEQLRAASEAVTGERN